MFGKAFKTRAHYVFDYKPRYYNERKERIEKLKEKYRTDSESSEDDVPKISLSKSHLKSEWNRSKGNATDKKSTRRLAIILVILVGIAAYIFDLHSFF